MHDSEILTKLWHEDETVIVVDCLICRVPMVVLKAHRASFSVEEKEHVRKFLRELVEQDNGELIASHLCSVEGPPEQIPYREIIGRGVIDWEQRQIPGHAHCHWRPQPFPGTKRWEEL